MSSTPDDASVPWARQATETPDKPLTDRLHRLVEGLPAWDPLPPGEILVVRSGRE
jgi:hypothetical protein